MSKGEKTRLKGTQKSSMRDEIKSRDKAFVLFYATWCPFSQHFLPIFEAYSKTNPAECFSVIVDEEPALCDECEIEYYPTVIMFKKGKINKRLDSQPHEYLTKEQLKKFTEKNNY